MTIVAASASATTMRPTSARFGQAIEKRLRRKRFEEFSE
jgi:hypothetical protein